VQGHASNCDIEIGMVSLLHRHSAYLHNWYQGRTEYENDDRFDDAGDIYLLTYLLTPWSRVILEKLTGYQLVKKFPCILWKPKVHHRVYKYPRWWRYCRNYN